MTDQPILVLSTCPPEATEALANTLVELKLAACVNIISDLKSIYRWQGQIESANECLLLIVTQQSCYHRLEKELQTRHPYDVPKIIALPTEAGLQAYCEWVRQSTSR